MKSASAIGSGSKSALKLEMFGLSFIVCKVNGNPLYKLSFDKSYRTLYELTMQSLDRDSQLFENGLTEEMFAKTQDIIVVDLPGIVGTATVRLEFTIAEILEKRIALVLLNQFEVSWEIALDGSFLLNLTLGTQIK